MSRSLFFAAIRAGLPFETYNPCSRSRFQWCKTALNAVGSTRVLRQFADAAAGVVVLGDSRISEMTSFQRASCLLGIAAQAEYAAIGGRASW